MKDMGSWLRLRSSQVLRTIWHLNPNCRAQQNAFFSSMYFILYALVHLRERGNFFNIYNLLSLFIAILNPVSIQSFLNFESGFSKVESGFCQWQVRVLFVVRVFTESESGSESGPGFEVCPWN